MRYLLALTSWSRDHRAYLRPNRRAGGFAPGAGLAAGGFPAEHVVRDLVRVGATRAFLVADSCADFRTSTTFACTYLPASLAAFSIQSPMFL